ncbi:MAG: hypothetical protein JO218_18600 [Burkholderiales bacterium]|nr:hypothetical protein [Burkholderiales bacterium]
MAQVAVALQQSRFSTTGSDIMWVGVKPGNGNGTMQERLARHYGAADQSAQSPRIATTDIDSSSKAVDLSWNQALTRAMEKSNALVEAQANIQQREAEVAVREQELAERERALKAERSRLQAALMFPTLKAA